MKKFKFLALIAYWTSAISDIVVLCFSEPVEEVSYDVQDVETPAFLRKAFGIKLKMEVESGYTR